MILGALIGDIVGSRFEFNNIKTKEFELFSKDSTITDDSVLTIAVMDWALNAKDHKKEAAKYLQKWAKRYPDAGYGSTFTRWKDLDNPIPYNSCGNGSAMRISSIGWLYDNEEELKEKCKEITEVTHNHPEGLKGAEVTAMCIYKARMGATKEEIKEYVSQYYNLNFDYDELVRTYIHGAEICQVTVPQAIYCFLISNSFEDCLRTTISIGGDCDTTAAISCAIAEAYYKKIPGDIIRKVLDYIPSDMQNVIDECELLLKVRKLEKKAKKE